MKSTITLLLAFMGCGFAANAAMTNAQCEADFNKCKNKIERLFDKGPCNRDRDACIAAVKKSAQRAETKNRMLNGERADERGVGLRRWEKERDYSHLDPKEAARLRLEDRARRNGEIIEPAKTNSMRDSLHESSRTEPLIGTARERRLEAEARMKKRQRAEAATVKKPAASGGSLRDSMKSN